MSPQSEALAFRIWAYAEPFGWNVTASQIADALGVSYQRIAGICRRKGWLGRLRAPMSRGPVRPGIEGSIFGSQIMEERDGISALVDDDMRSGE